MATTIQIKRSSTASGVPLSTDLAVGELAVNLADKRLFTKQSDGTIIELSTNPTDLDAATLRIDGVEITASATELNKLDGFTGSTTELNILDGLTATTLELNTLDGITASTAELNKLDGYTGSTAELNILDGVTATTAELNYVDGVTSNIQTQLNSKANLSGANFTGDVGVTGSFTVDGADESVGITAGTFGIIGSNTTSGGTGTTSVVLGTFVDDGNEYFVSLNRGGAEKLRTTSTGIDVTGDVATDTLTIDGTTVTATATELNYTDGVTSNIQTQLNGKATTAQGALADSAVQPDDDVSFGTGSFSGAVDVTGTVTADGLTVDGDGDFVTSDGAILKLENSTTAMTSGNTIGEIQFYANDGSSNGTGAKVNIKATTTSSAGTLTDLTFGTSDSTSNTAIPRLNISAQGDVSFYEDTGTTAKMVWDASAERLGIGTDAPIRQLHIYESGTGNSGIEIDNTQAGEGFTLGKQGSSAYGATSVGDSHLYTYDSNITLMADGGAGNTSSIKFATGGNSERMRIDSTGNVGIGTASPEAEARLSVAGGRAYFDAPNEYTLRVLKSGVAGAFIGTSAANTLNFYNGIGTERARIDSSGNFRVGNTSTEISSVGGRMLADGRVIGVTNNSACFTARRFGSDGYLISLFNKNGAVVGGVGTYGSTTFIQSDSAANHVGLLFNGSQVEPCRNDGSSGGEPRADSSVDLGSSGYRFKDLYLSGGVVTSSDYRLKEDIQPMQSYADTVKQMNLVNFAWKESGEREDGFIAHELQALLPSAVRGDKDAVNEDGEAQYQGVDPLKLIPVLTKALQEALERIETLENN